MCVPRRRYTCWHQYLNHRYTNEGGRIDYCLVDRSFFDATVVRPNPSLFNPSVPPLAEPLAASARRQLDVDSAEAAAAAATAGGTWRQAAFDGSGIPDGTQSAFDTQFRDPHTGMIYTPPAFSVSHPHVIIIIIISSSQSSPNLGTGPHRCVAAAVG